MHSDEILTPDDYCDDILIYPSGAEPLSFHAEFCETARKVRIMLCLGDMTFGTDLYFEDFDEAGEFLDVANGCITGEGELFLPLAFDIRKDMVAEDEIWRVIIHTPNGIIDTDILAYKDHIDFDGTKARLNAQTILRDEQITDLMQGTLNVFKDEHGRAFEVEPTLLRH